MSLTDTLDQPSVEHVERECVLEAKHVTKVYQTGDVAIHALAGVDLKLYQSELVVLVGASGSGKSTLLNILGGLDTPTEGEVLFCNQPLNLADDAAITQFRRQHVGFVFQFYNLIASLTAAENISLVTEISDRSISPGEALSMVGLGDRLDAFPAELSGGEQQRVAIARAIAKQPEILLCDEPTGALDSKTGILVLEAIAQINEQLGTTTALITHNRAIADMADRVFHFRDGKVTDTITNRARKSVRTMSW